MIAEIGTNLVWDQNFSVSFCSCLFSVSPDFWEVNRYNFEQESPGSGPDICW